MKVNNILAFSLSAVILAGCGASASRVSDDNFKAARAKAKAASERMTQISEEPAKIENYTNAVALGKPFKLHENIQLPSFFDAEFSFSQKGPIGFDKLIDRISESSFKVIQMTADAREEVTDTGNSNQMEQTDSVTNVRGIAGSESETKKYSVPSFKGKFRDLLDYVTSKAGVFWEWRDNKIVIFRNKQKTFIIDSQSRRLSTGSNVTTSSTSSSGGGGGGEGGASAQVNSSMSSKSEGAWDFWGGLEQQVAGMLTSKGVYRTNPALGTLVVVDTPTSINQIEDFIYDTNELAGKMITLNIEIYQVQTTGDFNFGIDWDLVFNDGTTSGALNTQGAFTSGVGQVASTLIDPTSKFRDSSILINALESQGNVSKVNDFVLNIMNGELMPIQDAIEVNYVKRSSTTVTQETVTSELEPGTAISGLTLDVRPQITSDGKLLIYSAFNIATLQTIETIQSASGDTQIQLPQRKLKTLYNNSKVGSGGTILVTGFKEMFTDRNQQGIGHHSAFFLGGSKSDKYNNSELVILITPYIMAG